MKIFGKEIIKLIHQLNFLLLIQVDNKDFDLSNKFEKTFK